MDDPKLPNVSSLAESYIAPRHAPVMETSQDDRSRRAASVLSMDDLEAAQALEGLRSGKSIPRLEPFTRFCWERWLNLH
jgi:hypothetical protein